MKCISIYPEYVDEYLSGEKTAEYRTYPTKHRGPLLFAVTATKQSNPFIFAVADLVDCVQIESTLYEWRIQNFTPIYPLYIVGKRRIYDTGYNELDIKKLNDEDANAAYDAAPWIMKGGEK